MLSTAYLPIRTVVAAAIVSALAMSCAATAAHADDLGRDQAAPSSVASGGSWIYGTSESDSMIDCTTGAGATAVQGQAAQFADRSALPRVGELFYSKLDIGYVGTRCTGSIPVLPEWMFPAGTEGWADDAHPIMYAIYAADSTGSPDWQSGTFFGGTGPNGGLTIQRHVDGRTIPWTLKRGEILTLLIPMRSSRVLKGTATRAPSCATRAAGTRPCPIAESGDHLQIAAHGSPGFKGAVIPYVGLFVQKANSSLAPKLSSTRIKSSSRAKLTVGVSSTTTATGTLVVKDGSRTIAKVTLSTKNRNRVSLSLPKLKPGKHSISISYAGSSAVNKATTRKLSLTVVR